jgi:hypothetical protein
MALELKVNPQIVDSVYTTRAIVLDEAPAVGGGIIYQQVAQSLGLIVQDSVSHLGQMLVLDAAITAKVAELMFLNAMDPEQGQKLVHFFQDAVAFSRANMQEVGNAAKEVLADFKSLLGG